MARLHPVLAVAVLTCVGEISCLDFRNTTAAGLARNWNVKENDVRDLMEEMKRTFLIFPGTKWCGAGNRAESYDDLGPLVETDKCCRDHDNCPQIIEPGETMHNLTNNASFTRLSCTCDETFHKCLRRDGQKASNIIGHIYFDLLGTKCFRKDYPVTGCRVRGGWLNKKCLAYEYDQQAPKIYQWFDVKNYDQGRGRL